LRFDSLDVLGRRNWWLAPVRDLPGSDTATSLLANGAGHAVPTSGEGDMPTLSGVRADQLRADDFLFAPGVGAVGDDDQAASVDRGPVMPGIGSRTRLECPDALVVNVASRFPSGIDNRVRPARRSR